MSITWKALQLKEFLGNLLKMSVLPCCPHNPASSVSAMLNETNFRGVTLEWRTEHEPPNFQHIQHPMSQKSKIKKLDVTYKDLNISPDNWTDLTVTMCAGDVNQNKWQVERGRGHLPGVTGGALIKTGKMRFNCAGYYRPHETPGTRSTVSSYWRNTININIIQMDGLIREINDKYFGKTENICNPESKCVG